MILVLLAVVPAAIHARAFGGRAFLSSNMQPEVVARTLRNVEDEWKAQAALFAQCDPKATNGISLVDCSDAPTSFSKSCSIIAGAVIQGSGGDRNVAKEYMADVCSQSAIKGWHQQKCQSLALAVSGAMSADSYQNRYNFNSQQLCASLWSRFLKEEGESMAAEKVSREASLKKAAEEEHLARELEKKEAIEEIARKKIELDASAKKKAQAAAAEAGAHAAQAVAVAKATKLKATKPQPTKPKAAPTSTAAKVAVAPVKATSAVIVAKTMAPAKAVVAKTVAIAAPVKKETAVPKPAAPSVAKPPAAKAAAKPVTIKTAVSPKAF